jgi:hypothetical protein
MSSFADPKPQISSDASLDKALASEPDPRLKFQGTWIRVNDEGFRELLVWMGVPWLLSFVVARKEMKLRLAFVDNDCSSNGTVELEMEEHVEHLKLNGTYEDVPLTQPFVRTVQCNAVWEGSNCMLLRRVDHHINGYKKHKTEATIRRTLIDANNIRSELTILRLTDNETKTAIIYLQRTA